MKQTLVMWLFKSLEIVLVALLGYLIYLLIITRFTHFWTICGLSVIFYFFSPKIKPYIDELRDWIFEKIV